MKRYNNTLCLLDLYRLVFSFTYDRIYPISPQKVTNMVTKARQRRSRVCPRFAIASLAPSISTRSPLSACAGEIMQ